MKLKLGGDATQRSARAVSDRIKDIADSIGERYSVKLSLPTFEAQKLGWFDAGVPPHQPARPVFLATPDLQRAVLDAVRARVRDLTKAGRINMLLALQAGAQAYRAQYVERLTRNGADIRWAPLSPRYARWKHERGLDPRTGVATGKTLAAVRASLVVIQRIG